MRRAEPTLAVRCLIAAAVLALSSSGCAIQKHQLEEEEFSVVPPAHPLLFGPTCEEKKPRRLAMGLVEPLRVVPTLAGGAWEGPIAVAFGGVHARRVERTGAEAAAAIAIERLSREGTARQAAIEGTVALEDDARFNAGTGSSLRLDGESIEMDAALMTSEGTFGGVGAISRVKNPILAAALVSRTPHALLVGEGATRFAHAMGLEDVVPTSTVSVADYQELRGRLLAWLAASGRAQPRLLWNFATESPEDLRPWLKGGDTAGVVTRDAQGGFAAAISSGGPALAISGRVGDVPVPGAGLFAGESGAVAVTGRGELLLVELTARRVYEAMAGGLSAKSAAWNAVSEIDEEDDKEPIGVIAIGRYGWGVAANRAMAFAKSSREDVRPESEIPNDEPTIDDEEIPDEAPESARAP